MSSRAAHPGSTPGHVRGAPTTCALAAPRPSHPHKIAKSVRTARTARRADLDFYDPITLYQRQLQTVARRRRIDGQPRSEEDSPHHRRVKIGELAIARKEILVRARFYR